MIRVEVAEVIALGAAKVIRLAAPSVCRSVTPAAQSVTQGDAKPRRSRLLKICSWSWGHIGVTGRAVPISVQCCMQLRIRPLWRFAEWLYWKGAFCGTQHLAA